MKFYRFKTARKTIRIKQRTLVMAVLNCTPDSFSDGGSYNTVHDAVNRALEMIRVGADIIDIGGESTKPGAEMVPVEEELQRTIPVIKALREKSDVSISIDTTKADVARQAISAGADIINDISSCTLDPKMKGVVLSTGAGVMLMHRRGNPQTMQDNLHYNDLIKEIKDYFTVIIHGLTQYGISREALMIDPGIGFSKSVVQNLQLVNKLDEFLEFKRPILLGTSRKSFIGKILDVANPLERNWGTAASIAVGITRGAAVVRVHDIKEMAQVTKLTDAIVNS